MYRTLKHAAIKRSSDCRSQGLRRSAKNSGARFLRFIPARDLPASSVADKTTGGDPEPKTIPCHSRHLRKSLGAITLWLRAKFTATSYKARSKCKRLRYGERVACSANLPSDICHTPDDLKFAFITTMDRITSTWSIHSWKAHIRWKRASRFKKKKKGIYTFRTIESHMLSRCELSWLWNMSMNILHIRFM